MKPKKSSPAWYIAATHYLTSGFAVPLIIGLIAGWILTSFNASMIVTNTVFFITFPLSLCLGVIYSAKYIKKVYVIGESQRIITFSTAYLIIVNGGLNIMKMIRLQSFDYLFLSVLLGIFVFYIFSKKFIRNNNEIIKQYENEI